MLTLPQGFVNPEFDSHTNPMMNYGILCARTWSDTNAIRALILDLNAEGQKHGTRFNLFLLPPTTNLPSSVAYRYASSRKWGGLRIHVVGYAQDLISRLPGRGLYIFGKDGHPTVEAIVRLAESAGLSRICVPEN